MSIETIMQRVISFYGLSSNPVKIPSNETTEQRSNIPQLTDNQGEKCYDPQDKTLKFVDEDDCLDFYLEGFRSKKAKMSCGHPVTPMSLTAWCRKQLEEGRCRFECGQTGCNALWPYWEVRKMALLTPDEREYFEKTMFTNAAKDYLNVKECPGCKSRVVRADLDDLSVRCTVCTARRGSAYLFCWQCVRQWKGRVPRSDRCENDDCTNVVLQRLKNCSYVKFNDVKGVPNCPCARVCPTCGLLVEHNGTRCKNITCPRCKKEFCFVCLQITTDCKRQTPYSYYGPCVRGVAQRQTSIPPYRK